MATDAASLFKSAAGATPWGAAFNLADSAISTPNTSAATGGKLGDSAFTFGGIQTGGSAGLLGGLPWYAYAALALIGVAFIAARRR